MRWNAVVCLVIVSWATAFAEERPATPSQSNQFAIGRHTYFDFGPPFDYYEVFVVRPTPSGSSIERILLTPPGNSECLVPAKLEVASAFLNDSPATLLAGTDPCEISEKALRRELKRCKDCLVFSGANVVMRIQCGDEIRLIRSDILDRDMFDPAAGTPEHTSWTMRLLGRLDGAVGPGVMDKPMFPTPEEAEPPATQPESETLRALIEGEFDKLFQGTPHKPSDLYRAAQNRPPSPSVRLLSSVPHAPEVFVQPAYLPLARMARVEGAVIFLVEVSTDGVPGNLNFESGHPMLRHAVKEAVGKWKFPKEASGQPIRVAIEFSLNCPSQP